MDDDLLGDLFKKTEDTISGPKHEFKEYNLNPSDLTGYSVVWYGTTGTGKTFHIRYCLNEVKHQFARVILFSPTNSMSGDFKGIINELMIIPELTEKVFIECIQAQKHIAEKFRNVVNNIDNLKKIFMKCATNDEMSKYNHILNEKVNRINAINATQDPPNIKAQKIENLNSMINDKLILFFKYAIIPKRQLIDVNGLSPVEIDCLRHIDMDPRTLFIFDDQQEELKDLSKKKGECALEFKNLFTKGRHYFFTTWFTYQDDSALLPAQRRSCKVSIFTDPTSANSFITRSTNGIDKESQKLGIELVSNIFSTDAQNHRKLIYFKEKPGTDKFQYTVAKNPGLFKVGSSVINNFCNSLTTQK